MNNALDNGTKKCKSCFSDINKKATICPMCKSDQRDFTWKHPIITLLFALLLISYFWSLFSWENKDVISNSWSCSYDVKETIRKQYKSPSTVNFLSCEYVKDWDVMTFVWDVDSQNGFWAIVRSSFVCKSWTNIKDTCEIFQK